MSDNWMHRSAHMRCWSCMWFVEKINDQPEEKSNEEISRHDVEADTSDSFGRCRRHSPTMAGFPAVFGTDWCGDHKLDENKR